MSTQQSSGEQAIRLTRWWRIGLVVVSLSVFVLIAWQVQTDGPLLQIDLRLQQAMQSMRSQTLVTAASWITLLGNATWVIGFAILISLPLIRNRHWLSLAGFWTTMIGAGASALALKGLIYRPRPVGLDGIIIKSSSFPSGNSILAAALFGAIILLVIPQFPSHRPLRVVTYVVALLPVLVAFSRIILSVHYLSDTIAGLAIGLAWALMGSLVAARAWHAAGAQGTLCINTTPDGVGSLFDNKVKLLAEEACKKQQRRRRDKNVQHPHWPR